MTVVRVRNGAIRYMPTADAIVQRLVSVDDIDFYEQMDVCFGRKKEEYEAKLEKQEGPVERHM